MTVTPAGDYACVANISSDNISVVDTASNTVSAAIAGFACPNGIAITPQARIPISAEKCKNVGRRNFGPPYGPFSNQGERVRYV